MKNKKISNKAFTLVELIVVITIIAILWTIAFISLQWYSQNARDWVRVSDMKNISKWLAIFFAKSWYYPLPENFSTITASWTIIRYQWLAWKNTLNTVWLTNIVQWSWRDPVSGEYYTYIIDGNKSQYNIIWYFENSSVLWFNFVNSVSASYTWWIINSVWNDLWMIYEWTIPLHEKYPNWIILDIRNTPNIYTIRFNSTNEVVWTWWILFANMYNRDRYLLNNKNLAYLDDSLVWYWDMESTIMSWSLLMLKDFSKNWNNWECHNWATIVNCWQDWPLIRNWNMDFDWVNDYIQINKNVYTDKMTVLVKVKPTIFDSARHWFFWYQNPWTNLRPFNLWMAPDFATWNWWFHYDSQDISATSLWEAWSNWKRCTANENYAYDKDAKQNLEFYVAYRRNPPFVNLNINWNNFIDRDCRVPSWTQVQTFNNFHSANALWIGRIDNYFKWTIDEVRIYNRTLSDQEVDALYKSTNYQNKISINNW